MAQGTERKFTVATRYNPDGSVKEVARYNKTRKDKLRLAEDYARHNEEFKAGRIVFHTGLWSW